jgi:hypothetical protein
LLTDFAPIFFSCYGILFLGDNVEISFDGEI